MEILQLLLSYLLENVGGEKIKPVAEMLKKNNYDIKKVVSELNPETILPLISNFINLNTKNQNPEPCGCNDWGLQPLSDFADAHIVDRLNQYFTSD